MKSLEMRVVFLAFVAVLFSGIVCYGAEGDIIWMTDIKAAIQKAGKENKDILMDFTGSDWCVWCKRLKDEVFDKEVFQKESVKKFVFVEFDFPRDESKLSAATKEQNKEWSSKLGVEGYPTIFLADSKGRVYAQTGYMEGGAEAYLKHLEELEKVKVKRDAAFAKAQESAGIEKAKYLHEALERLGGRFVMSSYREEIEKIIASDKDNEAGLRGRYEFQVDMADNEERYQGFMMQFGNAMGQGKKEDALELLGAELKKSDVTKPFRKELVRMRFYILMQDPNGYDEGIKVLDEQVAGGLFLGREKRELRGMKARVYAMQDKVEDAVKIYDKLVSESKKYPEEAIFYVVGKAELLYEKRRKAEALAVYGEAIKLGTKGALALQVGQRRAELLVESGKYDEAIAAFDKLLSEGGAEGTDKLGIMVSKAMALKTKGDEERTKVVVAEAEKFAESLEADTDPYGMGVRQAILEKLEELKESEEK